MVTDLGDIYIKMSKNDSAAYIGIACLVVLVIAILGILITSFIFMLAWNYFMVPVFGVNPIDYLTAFAGWVFISILGAAFKTVVSR